MLSKPIMLALLLLSAASPALSQAIRGSLVGTVTDSSGAAVPGATVDLTETQTGGARNVVTNHAGAYVVSNLSAGVYQVAVSHAGFRKVIRVG